MCEKLEWTRALLVLSDINNDLNAHNVYFIFILAKFALCTLCCLDSLGV